MPVIPQPANRKGAVVGSPNMFGAPPNNSNRQAISNNNFIQTNDGTLPDNLLSPQTVATTPTALTTPQNATTLTIIAGAAVQISEFQNMSQYATIPANVPFSIDVARQGIVYLQAPTGTAVVSFIYQTL